MAVAETSKGMESAAESGEKEAGIVPILLTVTLPLYILDQVTKFWVVDRFPPPWVDPEDKIVVIENYFNIVRVHNQGVAFGFGNGSDWAPVVFLIVPLIALTLITIGWRKNFFAGIWGKIAAGLLLCGILGNLTDRLVQGSLLQEMQGAPLWERLKAGYVVDFLDFTIPFVNYRWPSFNVADSCICVAAALLFFTGLKADMKRAKGS
jgi:signal peptidase II